MVSVSPWILLRKLLTTHDFPNPNLKFSPTEAPEVAYLKPTKRLKDKRPPTCIVWSVQAKLFVYPAQIKMKRRKYCYLLPPTYRATDNIQTRPRAKPSCRVYIYPQKLRHGGQIGFPRFPQSLKTYRAGDLIDFQSHRKEMGSSGRDRIRICPQLQNEGGFNCRNFKIHTIWGETTTVKSNEELSYLQFPVEIRATQSVITNV